MQRLKSSMDPPLLLVHNITPCEDLNVHAKLSEFGKPCLARNQSLSHGVLAIRRTDFDIADPTGPDDNSPCRAIARS
jgi:hypothetical protein